MKRFLSLTILHLVLANYMITLSYTLAFHTILAYPISRAKTSSLNWYSNPERQATSLFRLNNLYFN